MHEKKERGSKYYICDHEHREPVVLVANDTKDAAQLWAQRTGRKESEAVVTPIGTRAAQATTAHSSDKSVSPRKESQEK